MAFLHHLDVVTLYWEKVDALQFLDALCVLCSSIRILFNYMNNYQYVSNYTKFMDTRISKNQGDVGMPNSALLFVHYSSP